MKKFIAIGLAILLGPVLVLSACSDSNGTSKAQHERTEIVLKVKLFDTKRELNEYINSNFDLSPVTRSGLARWYEPDPTNECTVYLVRGFQNEERTYGHELQHCIYGAFHKE